MRNNEEQQTLKDIKRGTYRGSFLIYNRRSTDDADNQKNSIKYQKAENTRFAYREHLPIASLTLPGFATDGIVSERHSGFAEDLELTFGSDHSVRYRVERPKFHRLVQWLSEGHFRGVIFLCWDRASRNKGDDTILRKLIKSGVDIRFALAQYDKTSAGELHMDIDGMFAEHHSRVTREKVMLAQRSARLRGLVTHKAAVGYLNTGSMEHKPLDPARAPIIRRLFELADTGQWGLEDLTRWAIAQGFTMSPLRRRRTRDEMLSEEDDDVRLDIAPVSRLPTSSAIHRILTNPFYTGKVLGGDGAWVKSASHEAIVSDDLFVRVQAIMRKRRTSAHYAKVLAHPFRRMVHCAICGRTYTPYEQKGIIYYGARCDHYCTNRKRNVNLDFVAKRIGALIERLCRTEEFLAEFEAKAAVAAAQIDAGRQAKQADAEQRKKTLREDLAYLDTNRLALLRSGAYTALSLVEEEGRLKAELETLRGDDTTGGSIVETARAVVNLSELLKNVALYYGFATLAEKERIARIIFSELSVFQETLQYKARKGFQVLETLFAALGAPTATLSELAGQREEIQASIQALKQLLPPQGQRHSEDRRGDAGRA